MPKPNATPSQACGIAKKPLGEGVARGKKECAERQYDDQPVQRQDEHKGKQCQPRGQQQRFTCTDLARHQRPLARTLDVSVEIAVGIIVDDTARTAHQHGAQHEDPHDEE
jgi:hypothetical protein